MRHAAPLGQLTPRTFLQRHWQKSPHLIRQAFPRFSSPLSIEQFPNLAGEPGVEARLVQRIARRPYWQVRYGPFARKNLGVLPNTRWTLLIQDCDKHRSELAEFLACFDFIPHWRTDDLMISYAVKGGSVGPHVDAYDVFLLQAQGRRRWDISRKPQRVRSHPQLDLKLVAAFKPQHSWILEPGDMLYLPPGVAHHGIALEEGLTFSIGFRAPSDTELLADLNAVLMTRIDPQSRYTDGNLKSAHADPGRISLQARTALRRRLRAARRLPDTQLDEWFGCFITEPKSWLAPQPPKRNLRVAQLCRKLEDGAQLECHLAARLAWFPDTHKQIKLFANGHCHTLPARLDGLVQLLCQARVHPLAQLRPWLRDRAGGRLLVTLYNAGLLQLNRAQAHGQPFAGLPSTRHFRR